MSTQAIDVVTTIVKCRREYFDFKAIIPLRIIYGLGFWLRLTEPERRYFGMVFKNCCERLGFKHTGYENGINVYRRIY